MNNKVREIGVAVVYDDHKLFASTFAMLLERTGYFSAVHYFSTESDVIVYFRSYNKSRIFLFADYYVPGTNAFHLLADLRRFKPSLSVIIISSLNNASVIRKLMTQKIDGFLSKSGGTEEVIACIEAIDQKQSYVSPYIENILKTDVEETVHLTSRELEILDLIASGASTAHISASLNIATSTVLTHRKNMLAKSRFNSITELLAYALKKGLIINN